MIHFSIYLFLFFMSAGCGSENQEPATESKGATKDSVAVFTPNAAVSHKEPLLSKEDTMEMDEDASFELGNKVFDIETCSLAEFLRYEKQYKDTTEEDYLRRDASLAKRVRKSLLLTLKNNKVATLIDKEEDSEEVERYTYQGRLKELGQYVAHVQYYESDGYVVVNENSGEATYLNGRPISSPSNKYVITGNCDLDARLSYNGIELYEVQTEGLELIGKKELNNWGPKQMYWENDSTLIVERNVTTEQTIKLTCIPNALNYTYARESGKIWVVGCE